MNFSKIPVKNFQLWKRRNRELSKEAKIIYLFLFSSPLTSMSGIFETPELSKTGLNQKELKIGMQQLIKTGLVILDEENEIIAVPEMIKINEPKGSKQESGYFKYIDEIEDFEKWDAVINYMVSIGYNENVIGYLKGIDRVSIGYARGIDRVCDSVSIQVEEEVKVEVKVEEEVKDNIVISDKPKRTKRDYSEYLEVWNNFLDYMDNNKFKLKRTTEAGFKSMINNIKKEEKKGLSIQVYREALNEALSNSFLFGDNNRGWKMDMLFLMKEDNRAKLYAGKYIGDEQRKSDRNEFHELKQQTAEYSFMSADEPEIDEETARIIYGVE